MSAQPAVGDWCSAIRGPANAPRRPRTRWLRSWAGFALLWWVNLYAPQDPGAMHRPEVLAGASPLPAAAFRADNPAHPDHRGFDMFHGAIKVDGRWSEVESRNIAAVGLAAVKADPIVGNQLAGVVVGTPNITGNVSVFGYSSAHGPQGPHHHVGVDAAAPTPAERRLDRVEQLNRQQVQQQQQAQQIDTHQTSFGGPTLRH